MERDICEICKELFDESIYKLKKMIHHKDGNHDNDDLNNRTIIHFRCHTSLHMTGKHYNRGRHYSDDHRQRISESLKGKMVGDKNPMYGRRGKDSPFYGRQLSEETRRKISMTSKGRECSEKTRKRLSIAGKGRKFSEEHIARLQLSRKIGKNNYAEIKAGLIWFDGKLFNVATMIETF